MFLDEPTVGLDVEARRLMWTQIRALVARGKTVLLTTHYLNEADALADRIVVLSSGRVVAEGTPAEIKSRAIGKQVRFSSRLSLDEIRAIPGVTTVTADREKYELQVQCCRAGSAGTAPARFVAFRPRDHYTPVWKRPSSRSLKNQNSNRSN